MAGARVEATAPADPHAALALVAPWLRGFAYEGAGTSAAVVDLLVPGSRRLSGLLDGAGHGYRHLVHVGAGWALPLVHRRYLPHRLGLDPLLRWLALDGAGFCRTFFAGPDDRRRLLARPAKTGAAQVEMNGSGRALWFTSGADLDRIAASVSLAAPVNRGPLWSGVGLAAGYAGAPGLDVERLADLTGRWVPQLRQGMVFAAAARASHGAVMPDDPLAAVTGLSPDLARDRCDTEADRLVSARPGPLPVSDFRRWQHAFELEGVVV